MLSLYTYFRSSASYRVRIALALKGLAYESKPIHLVRNGGEQHSADFAALNPAQLVPVLQDGDTVISQSLAILEYLEETHPTPALLPPTAADRAHVRAMAQLIACEIHPINNLRVLGYLKNELGLSEEVKNSWYQHWCRTGLEAFERQLVLLAAERNAQGLPPSTFCWGDSLTLADCALVPQIFNAQRFNVNLEGLPLTMAAYNAAMATEAVQKAQPSACPDAQA